MKLFSFFFVCAATLAFGQATTSLRGHVIDPSGAAIPGARIHLTRTGTNLSRDAVTSNEGYYEMLQLVPIAYTATIRASGFADAQRDNLDLQVSLPATADFLLQVAGAAQTVDVREAGAPMVNTSDATFNVGSLGNRLDSPNNFGVYTQTLTNPRIMQVAMRVEF